MLKQRVAAFGLCLLLGAVLFAPRAAALEPGDVSAKAAVLYCPDTGELLFAKRERERRPIASTTKIMTALLAVERATPERVVRVSEEMVRVEGSSMGLLPGDSVTLRNLIYGMLLESGNDAANVTAYVLGGSIEGFAGMMNAKARELGMRDTQFVTPSGLDAEGHYSTAYDMALLAAYAVRNPQFATMCAQKSVRVSYGNPPYLRTLSNHNRLLDAYEGCFGIKTGFTKKSGRCLVSAAERDGVTLICVTLGAPDDWSDHQALFDYGFANVRSAELPAPEGLRLAVVGGAAAEVDVECAYRPVIVYSGMPPETRADIYLNAFVYAPVERGQVVGTVVYRTQNGAVAEAPLVAARDVAAKPLADMGERKPSLGERAAAFWKKILGK